MSAALLGGKFLGRNDLQPRCEGHIGLYSHCEPPLQPPLAGAALRHRRTVCQSRAARSARHQQVACVPLLRLHRRKLMEDIAPVRLYARESVGDVQVVRVHDRVLGDVLDLVGLGVGIRDVGVLVVVVEPVLGRGEGFVGIGA